MIIAVAFFARKKKYNQLLTVFKNSLRKAMPKIHLRIIKMKKPKSIDHKRDTAYAFLAAAKYALNHKKGVLAVADCDLMFLKSIEDINKIKFDIAVTVRNKMKYNTGLWFYRPTPRAVRFVRLWIKNTEKLMKDFCKYEDFCWQHGGIDQASLYMTIQKIKGVNIKELPCLIWNATQSEWRTVDDTTKVIHIKSQLRGFCCKDKIEMEEKWEFLKPLIKKWRSFLYGTA